jgi:rSAM/selenodomain-associated transferase 1
MLDKPVAKNLVIVFVRPLKPGTLKTRLSRELGEADTLALYEAMVADVLQMARRSNATTWLALAEDGPVPKPWIAHKQVLQRDEGVEGCTGLGARMVSAFADAFAAGYERVCIIGSDCLLITSDLLDAAFEAMDEPESVVVGPADDGGYYLIGMNDLMPELFEGRMYSHARVFEELLERVEEVDAQLILLPPLSDIDTMSDLRTFVQREDRLTLPCSRVNQWIEESWPS